MKKYIFLVIVFLFSSLDVFAEITSSVPRLVQKSRKKYDANRGSRDSSRNSGRQVKPKAVINEDEGSEDQEPVAPRRKKTSLKRSEKKPATTSYDEQQDEEQEFSDEELAGVYDDQLEDEGLPIINVEQQQKDVDLIIKSSLNGYKKLFRKLKFW